MRIQVVLSEFFFHGRWEAASYSKVSFTVPDNWKAGRIWVCGNFRADISCQKADIAPYCFTRRVVTAISGITLGPIHAWTAAATVDCSVILILALLVHYILPSMLNNCDEFREFRRPPSLSGLYKEMETETLTTVILLFP